VYVSTNNDQAEATDTTLNTTIFKGKRDAEAKA
jgi:hypothetical protein